MSIPDSSLSDAELMAWVQQQDLQADPAGRAFGVLYERYAEAICRHLDGMVRNEAAAQDLLQEVFLRVWQRAEQWNGQGAFKGWLYRIATNQALNWLRSQRRKPEQPLVMPDEGSWDEWSEDEESSAPGWLVDHSTLGPAAELEQAERSAYLRGMINALPAEKREVFRMVHEMELSLRDTAGRLGIPEGTVKSRLYYAQKKLSEEWSEWEK